MWNILFCILFFISCNPDINLRTKDDKIIFSENEKKGVYIIGSGFNLNNEGTLNLILFKDCYLLDPAYIKLSAQNESIIVELNKNCNQIEVSLSSLIGHNNRHILHDGDTLQLTLQKNGVMVRQSNKQYWESNFYHEVNKREIGSNLFFTKFIFQNKGKKPTRNDLFIQTSKENELIDSLAISNLISSEASIELKNQVTLNTLLCLMRMQDLKGYEEMNVRRTALVKNDTGIIKGSLAKKWIVKELLSNRMSLPEEKWDRHLDISVIDTIEKYYDGIFHDFLVTHIFTNLFPESLNQSKRDSIRNQVSSLVYREYLNDWASGDIQRDSLGFSELLNAHGDVKRFEDIINFKGITYLDFWASWCAPCRSEMPFSQSLQQKMKGQAIQFVYISLDDKLHAWQKANKSEGLIDYPESFLLAHPRESDIVKQYNITAIPRYIILDQNGNVINKNAPPPSDTSLSKLLEGYMELLEK